MTEFTPWSAIGGGALIGLAAALSWLGNGRIAGVSGILAGAFHPPEDRGRSWRLAFLIGLPIGAGCMDRALGGLVVDVAARPFWLAVAGLLVGFGTRLGSGCTSGHGVCGIARGSRRSIAATVVFMVSGAATVFMLRHAFGGAP